MILFGDDDKLRKYRYTIKTIEVLIPGEETITIPPERFINIQLLEYYETHMFPIFYIKLGLEDFYYYLIIKNKDEARFHIRIDKWPPFNENEIESGSFSTSYDSSAGLTTKWIDSYYSLIADDDTDDMSKSEKEKRFNANYENTTSDSDPASDEHTLDKEDNVVEFYLFDKSKVDGTKTLVNKVFNNVTITDVYMWLFQQAKFKNGSVLMAPVDNKTVYKELFIPNMSIMSAFKYLDTYYGLYSTGSYIYMGLDKMYVLPFSGKCNAFQKNEIKYTGIIIPEILNTEHSTSCGSLEKKVNKIKSRYVVADCRTFKARNLATSNDYLNSNDLELVDSYSGEKTKNKSNATKNNNKKDKKKKKKKKTYSMGKRTESLLTKKEKEERKNFVKQIENPTENQFYGTAYVARSDSMSVVISLTLMDYDISAIHLNKQFNIYFEDNEYYEKYKGSYAILSATHGFTKLGEENFQINTNLILARTTENYGQMYDIFGKVKVSKDSQAFKSKAKYIKPVPLFEESESDKAYDLNITNVKITSEETYSGWWTELCDGLNQAMISMDTENKYREYLEYFSQKKYDLDNCITLTMGIVTFEMKEPVYQLYDSKACDATELVWADYKEEIPIILTKTDEEIIKYYNDNIQLLEFIRVNFADIIGGTSEYYSVVGPLESKVKEIENNE